MNQAERDWVEAITEREKKRKELLDHWLALRHELVNDGHFPEQSQDFWSLIIRTAIFLLNG